MIYTTIEYFIENYGSEIPEEKIERFIKKASKEIDNNLITIPTTLSDYEKEIFNDVTCELAIFLYGNGKYINTILNSVSIAGTSYSFENGTIKEKINDILLPLCRTQYMNCIG